MNSRIEAYKKWFEERTTRQKIGIIALSFVFIYYLWDASLIGPIHTSQEELQTQITQVKASRDKVQQQYNTILNIVQTPSFKALLQQQQQLSAQSKDIKSKISSFTPLFVSVEDFPKVTKDIINQVDKNIVLLNIKEFPDQRFTMPDIDKTTPLLQNVYQHKILVEFHADYFSAMEYLARIEKLPWHLYWESMEYTVLQYPLADIKVQVFVLNTQAGI